MNKQKGFAAIALLIGALALVVVGGVGYVMMRPERHNEVQTSSTNQESNNIQTRSGNSIGQYSGRREDATTDEKISIAWRLADAGEVDGVFYTKVAVVINGTAHEIGKFVGSCSEIGATGGVDGKGLLAGELSAMQCWFAGGGNEIGVFAHEDGGVDIMVGSLSEGEEGKGLFRGDFSIKKSLEF